MKYFPIILNFSPGGFPYFCDINLFNCEVAKILKNISTFFLALAVAFSTLSFSISRHYCGNLLINKAVYKKDDTCCSASPTKSSKENLSGKDCCSNTILKVNGQNELTNYCFSFKTFQFPVPDSFDRVTINIPLRKSAPTIPNIDPPPLREQLFIYFGAYLI
ncbi:hypothetical protein [Zunongwangia sp. H14]|uniref:HYC_CC_PP family protein n=1 Tax=Zunongwangia sp. H14 TaxID=3240792 RepID=UPI00356AE0C0